MKRAASLFNEFYWLFQNTVQLFKRWLLCRCCISLAGFWQFVMSFEETTFFIERKWFSFSRHDFNVQAAAASGHQLEADGLPRGSNGAAAARNISNMFHGSKIKKIELL